MGIGYGQDAKGEFSGWGNRDGGGKVLYLYSFFELSFADYLYNI